MIISLRAVLLLMSLLAAFFVTLTVTSKEAEAVTCARGMHRAGCAGPRGAAVVRRPVAAQAACRTVIVNGAAVRRCT